MKNKILKSFFLFAIFFMLPSFAKAATVVDYDFSNQSWGILYPNVDNPTNWSIQSTGGVNGGPAIRNTYATSGTFGNQLLLDLAAYTSNEFWVEFDTKIDNQIYGGMKFVKFFGHSPPDHGDSNDNMTFGIDYYGKRQSAVGYQWDVICGVNYDGTIQGGSSCASMPTFSAVAPNQDVINLGNGTWGHYKLHVKRASQGTHNGTVTVWWNGTLIVDMANMSSNEPVAGTGNENGNPYFDYMTFGDYSNAEAGYSTWYFWIDNLYVGTTEKVSAYDSISPSAPSGLSVL